MVAAIRLEQVAAFAGIRTNTRSGNILLCNTALRTKKGVFSAKGCNSWKGRFFDKQLRELLNGRALAPAYRKVSEQYAVALSCTAYLAMVLEFGYQVALMQSGVLMREHFFYPQNSGAKCRSDAR